MGELGIRTDLDLRRPDETADLAVSPIGPDSSTNVTDIPELDAAGYRVFKVKVQMKE